MPYDRQKFADAVKERLEPNMFNHSLALEACMGAIHDYLKEQGQLGDAEPLREDWLLAGLVHDIDYSGEYKELHPTKTREVLSKFNLEIPDAVENIVKAHSPDLSKRQAQNKAEWAIFCADSLTGLIVAVALVYPSKKLADVKSSSVLKRFIKEPRFAAGTRREEVAKCANADGLNIPLEKFIEICLEAMRGIAADIGL
jgi:uncharacterized protein